MLNENKRIQVCNKCLRACCWYGIFMCDESRGADLVIKTVKELREMNTQESEDYWSDEQMEEIYGDPNPFAELIQEKSHRKKVYIVGAITGVENWKGIFTNAKGWLLTTGNSPIILSPLDYPEGLTQKEYMMLSVQNVFIADKLYVLRGYENSWGTQAEIALAKSIGMDIEYQE